MRYHYRCTNRNSTRQALAGRIDCGKRKTLSYKVYDLECECGNLMKLDPAVKRWNMKHICRCDGAHYPHMKGQVSRCRHYDKQFDDEYYRQQDESIGELQ